MRFDVVEFKIATLSAATSLRADVRASPPVAFEHRSPYLHRDPTTPRPRSVSERSCVDVIASRNFDLSACGRCGVSYCARPGFMRYDGPVSDVVGFNVPARKRCARPGIDGIGFDGIGRGYCNVLVQQRSQLAATSRQ